MLLSGINSVPKGPPPTRTERHSDDANDLRSSLPIRGLREAMTTQAMRSCIRGFTPMILITRFMLSSTCDPATGKPGPIGEHGRDYYSFGGSKGAMRRCTSAWMKALSRTSMGEAFRSSPPISP